MCMSPLVITGVCVVLAAGIVAGVWRLVKSKNTALHQSSTSLQRAKARADASGARADAYQDVAERITGMAENAVAQTGAALHVAQQIDKVSTQMDALMYRVAEGETHGRHAHGPDALHTLHDELGFVDDDTIETRYMP
jgi:hypothetical protein